MLGPKVGMGPRVAQNGNFAKCDVKKIDNCPDSCCAIIPCRLCLHITTYTEEFWGLATYRPDDDDWYGFVNDREFLAKWERNYYGQCEFIVLLDDVEVFREPICEAGYGGVKCDQPEGSVDIDEVGLLEWTVQEMRPLPYVVDPETGCMIHFCAVCECAPKSLCVLVTKPGGNCEGVLEDTSYPCDGPVWQGSIPCTPSAVDMTLSLTRDPYTDDCLLGGTYDGETLEDKVVGCSGIGTSWTLDGDITVTVSPKYCDCDEVIFLDCCSPRCLPLEVVSVDEVLVEVPGTCDDPLPLTLTIDLFGSSADGGDAACFNGSGTLTFKTPLSYIPGTNCWDGEVTGNCTDCHGNVFNWSMFISVCCLESGRFAVSYYASNSTCTGFSTDMPSAGCSPMLLEGCFPELVISCFVSCLDDVTPIPSPTFTVCYQIYEMP